MAPSGSPCPGRAVRHMGTRELIATVATTVRDVSSCSMEYDSHYTPEFASVVKLERTVSFELLFINMQGVLSKKWSAV